jgi:hypothetical protein
LSLLPKLADSCALDFRMAKTQSVKPKHSHRRGFSHPLHTPFRLWLNALPQRPVEMLFAATLLLLLLGGTLLYLTERNSPVTNVRSWWDACWLCITSLTENYGDVLPTTTGSRLVTVFVTFLGILLIGSFTSVATNYMTGQTTAEHFDELDEIQRRLERIEQMLSQSGKQEKSQ